MPSLSLVILVCVGVVCVNCQVEMSEQRVQKREPGRNYCGRYLSDTLSLVCQGTFAGWKKRDFSYDDNMLVDDLYNYHNMADDEDSKWPLLSYLSSANALVPRGEHQSRYKRQRGIIEECCINSCTIKQLKQYCSNK